MHRSSPGATSISRSSLESTYKKTVLPGGLSIVTEEIPYLKSISVGIWIEVGSRDEDARNNGITHFIEHMVFKGTRHYSLRRIAQSLESVGGYLNAFTSKEHTCYYARALDADLALSIDVLTDLVEYPLFEAKEIEKEKQVVLEEMKNIEDDPDELINDFFDESVYQRHPLGYPVIGKADNIRAFTRDDLLAHYTISTHRGASSSPPRGTCATRCRGTDRRKDEPEARSACSCAPHKRSKRTMLRKVYEQPILGAPL
jgi:predicted Zn-dependent peptidase